MASTNSTITLKEAMTSGFPTPMPEIMGTPTLMGPMRLCRHLITCAQSQTTRYNHLSCLFLVVPQVLWNMYVEDTTADSYPRTPQDPGATPNYGAGTLMEIQIAKDLHNKQNKDHQEYENMNMALTDRFLSTLAARHSDAYYTILITEPNQRFGVTFQYFYDLFDDRDEREIEVNRDNLKQPWNMQQGFQFTKARFQDGTNFAEFAK
jgi:hypothetical protein